MSKVGTMMHFGQVFIVSCLGSDSKELEASVELLDRMTVKHLTCHIFCLNAIFCLHAVYFAINVA